ncbi:MAG: class I SAM-dependent methyltransferase [Fibrobacterota bacterium]|nr:class I SAM-dependent methyltransferase [Fibrobacterota bacterium]
MEIDLLRNYPRSKRNVKERGATKTEAIHALARQFGKDFFDGERDCGYGGFNYSPRFWQPVIPDFSAHFGLTPQSSLLDVGCAKGFMLFDLSQAFPGIKLSGVDVSSYAVSNCIDSMKPNLQVADARSLPFADDSFDIVTSINTVHNLDRDECGRSLQEIERVSRGKSFITVDAYRSEDEKEAMYAWNLTAKTIMHADEWVEFFREVGYTGDYYWFIP